MVSSLGLDVVLRQFNNYAWEFIMVFNSYVEVIRDLATREPSVRLLNLIAEMLEVGIEDREELRGVAEQYLAAHFGHWPLPLLLYRGREWMLPWCQDRLIDGIWTPASAQKAWWFYEFFADGSVPESLPVPGVSDQEIGVYTCYYNKVYFLHRAKCNLFPQILERFTKLHLSYDWSVQRSSSSSSAYTYEGNDYYQWDLDLPLSSWGTWIDVWTGFEQGVSTHEVREKGLGLEALMATVLHPVWLRWLLDSHPTALSVMERHQDGYICLRLGSVKEPGEFSRHIWLERRALDSQLEIPEYVLFHGDSLLVDPVS